MNNTKGKLHARGREQGQEDRRGGGDDPMELNGVAMPLAVWPFSDSEGVREKPCR